MQNWCEVKLISSAQDLFNLKQAALNAYHSIYLDYFPDEDFCDFESHHMWNESVVMKAAAYRFLTPEVRQLLFQSATLAGSLDYENHAFHPIFYLRLTKVGGTARSSETALLDSQPHFDRSFGVSATSFWLALEDANIRTGGLCFFSEPLKEFAVEWGEPNRYSYEMYLADHKLIDSGMRSKIVHPSIRAGSAYMFNSDALHAATKGTGGVRLSFDFRIVSRSKLIELDQRNSLIFELADCNIALANAMNLRVLGDNIGAKRYVERYNLDKELVLSVDPITNIKQLNNRMIWRNEYSCINLILADKVKLRSALRSSVSTVSAGAFEP